MSKLQPITVTVNGQLYEKAVEPRRLLVHLLRHDLDLTGTHEGCETSQCGCCIVMLNGRSCKSCTLLAVQASGATITTIEGISANEALHPLQEAFRLKHGLQCGFCTPGIVMAALDLLERHPHPSEAYIRHALHGNMCRCTGYQHIVDAILEAAHLVSHNRSVGPHDIHLGHTGRGIEQR